MGVVPAANILASRDKLREGDIPRAGFSIKQTIKLQSMHHICQNGD